MKKFFLLLLVGICSVSLFASESIDKNDVTMVSYEQSWLDSDGALALKNNTDKTITSVSFRLCYFNMKGEQLDYKDFNKKVNIDPGMTRKVTVKAYEHGRDYNYYKSERCYNGTSFKLTFELIGYKTADDVEPVAHKKNSVTFVGDLGDDIEVNEVVLEDLAAASARNNSFSYDEMMGYLKVLTPLAFYVLILSIFLWIMVPFMAARNGRSAFGWLLLSLIISPFVALLFLALLGRRYVGGMPMDNNRRYNSGHRYEDFDDDDDDNDDDEVRPDVNY